MGEFAETCFKSFVTLQVSNIPFGTTTKDIKNLFRLYGSVESVKMKNTETNSIAYVCLITKKEILKQCITDLKLRDFKGSYLTVEILKKLA